jgi:hypothetical protein
VIGPLIAIAMGRSRTLMRRHRRFFQAFVKPNA